MTAYLQSIVNAQQYESAEEHVDAPNRKFRVIGYNNTEFYGPQGRVLLTWINCYTSMDK